jgi:hypothetical protein
VKSRSPAPQRGPTERDRVRHLFGGRYTKISGHCIYCGAFSWGRLCQAHHDLPPIDPLFAATIVALAR